MKVHIVHQKDELFRVENPTGAQVVLGRGDGFRPMEMVLGSIASCASIDILHIFEKQKMSPKSYKIEVEGNRVDSIPSVFDVVNIHFFLEGDIPLNKAQRAIKLSVEKYCSVGAMLKDDVVIRPILTLNNQQYEIQ
jgi:putative redox protein